MAPRTLAGWDVQAQRLRQCYHHHVNLTVAILLLEPREKFGRVFRPIAESDDVEELAEEKGSRGGGRKAVAKSLVDLPDVRLGGIVSGDEQDTVRRRVGRRCGDVLRGGHTGQ